jgi:hypothetical protein
LVFSEAEAKPSRGSDRAAMDVAVASPPLTCENMIPAQVSNFFASCQSATKETAFNLHARHLLLLFQEVGTGCFRDHKSFVKFNRASRSLIVAARVLAISAGVK